MADTPHDTPTSGESPRVDDDSPERDRPGDELPEDAPTGGEDPGRPGDDGPAAGTSGSPARRILTGPLARLVAGVVVVALASALSLLVHPASSAGEDVATTSVRSLTCPALGATATLTAGSTTGSFAVGGLGGTPADVTGLVQKDAAKTSWLLMPSGVDQPVGGILSRTGQWQWAGCEAASPSSYINVPDLSTSDLLLVNPDPVSVAVNLTFFTTSGVRSVAGARGLVLQPGSSRVVPLSVLAGSGPAGIWVATDSGRVLALARPITTQSYGPQPARQPGLITSLPAVPQGAHKVTLLVTNPGDEDATFSVAGLTRTGRIQLAGAQQVTVAAQHVLRLDISKQVAGEEMALEVSSDRPVVASALVGDPANGLQVSAAPVKAQLNAVVPTDASLYVMNPDAASATVQVSLSSPSGTPAVTSRIIASGGLAVITLQKGTVLHLSSSHPVAAAVGMISAKKVVVMASATEAAVTGSVSLSIDQSNH